MGSSNRFLLDKPSRLLQAFKWNVCKQKKRVPEQQATTPGKLLQTPGSHLRTKQLAHSPTQNPFWQKYQPAILLFIGAHPCRCEKASSGTCLIFALPASKLLLFASICNRAQEFKLLHKLKMIVAGSCGNCFLNTGIVSGFPDCPRYCSCTTKCQLAMDRGKRGAPGPKQIFCRIWHPRPKPQRTASDLPYESGNWACEHKAVNGLCSSAKEALCIPSPTPPEQVILGLPTLNFLANWPANSTKLKKN